MKLTIEDLRLPCEHRYISRCRQEPSCGGGRVPTRQELIDTLGNVIEKHTVETFLNSLTEIEAGPDEWPEYAALLVVLGEYTDAALGGGE